MTNSTDIAQVDLLSAEAIFAAEDVKTEIVDVPEWGGKVLVRGLSGADRDEYQASLRKMNPKTGQSVPNTVNATAKFLTLCMVKADGTRLFTSTTDVAALGRKNAAALQRVNEVAERLSGYGQQAEKDAEGNSETTPSDGSTSSEPAQPASQ